MSQLIKSSLIAGTTALIMFWLIMMIRDPITALSENMLFGIVSSSILIWIIGFIFSFLLLVPLRFVYIYGSNSFSLFIFTVVGFIIPALVMFWVSSFPAHGETPALYKADNQEAIMGILTGGVMGASGALLHGSA